MPKAYRIANKEEGAYGFRYCINCSGSALVPPVHCPSCGDVRPWGFCYPTLDVAGLGKDTIRELHLRDDGVLESIAPDDYSALEVKLSPLLGPDRPLSPLTSLGALCGRAEGKFGDFAWPSGQATPFVRQSVFSALQKAGFVLTVFRPELAYRRERQDPLIGIEVLPTARAHSSELREACSTCGFVRNTSNKNVKLDATCFDDSQPLQCVLERPDIVLANEALAQFIRGHELSDIALIPMKFE